MQGKRSIAVLLLVTMATALPGIHAMALPAAQAVPLYPVQLHPVHLHPAGCHGPRPAAPVSPWPSSYQCCVNGHRAAIPNASFTLGSIAAQLCGLNLCDGPRLEFISLHNPATWFAPSNSPPGAAPLRI